MNSDQDFYRDLLDHLYDGVYFVDRDRRITYWNKGAERISGFNREQVIGRRCADNLLMHVDDQGTCLCLDGCPLADTILDGQVREAQVYLHHARGHRVPVLVRASPLRDAQGNIVGAVETFSDNSSLIAAVRRINELSQAVVTDPLTQVGNRRFIESRLAATLDELSRHQLPGGVLFIDIDRFKSINDVYGHEAGDQALQMVAETLRLNLRNIDALGRWGGEEFLAIVVNADAEKLRVIAEKLRALVAASRLPTPQGDLQVTVSIGATPARPDDTPESIMRRVDGQLYQSKTAGRDRVSFAD